MFAENYLAEGSETSNNCQSRIQQLEDGLREEGYEEEEVKCTLQSVYLVTWLDEMWANMYENHQMAFREWCLDQLTRFEFDLQTKSDIEAMVRALCTILGYTYEMASSHVLRVWYSSPMGSVALTGSKRTSSQGVPPLGVQQYATFSTPTP